MPPTKYGLEPNQIFEHMLSALLAVFLFYSVISAANVMEIPFYLGYKPYIMNISILTPMADRALWASSITVFSTLYLAKQARKKPRNLRLVLMLLYGFVLTASTHVFLFGSNILGTVALVASGLAFTSFSIFLDRTGVPLILTFFYGMLIFLGIEMPSLGSWVYHLFQPSPVFADDSWSAAFVEAQISSILYPVLPAVLMFFSFSWVGAFTFKGLLAKKEGAEKKSADNRFMPHFNSVKISVIVTLLSAVVALFIGYYNSAVAGVHNPAFPGTDVLYYIEHLKDMLSASSTEAFSIAAGNDRFLYLVLQYICFPLGGASPEMFVTFFMPVILTFLLMFSTYMLVRVDRSHLHAATSMLVTALSFQVTVGVHAGFFANWFALSFAYVFYGLMMTAFKKNRNLSLLALMALTSFAVLYTHPWTWILLVMINLTAYAVATLLLIWFRKKNFREHLWELAVLAFLLVLNLAMFYVRGFLRVGSGAGLVDGYVNVKTFQPSFLNAFKLKDFLDQTFDLYLGGFYAYAPLILFAILGVLSFLDYGDQCNRLLLTWMLIPSAMVFVEFPWQARFLYMTPFNIYAGFGILHAAEKLSKFAESKDMRNMAPLIFWVFYALSILFLLNYAVRCVVIKQFGPSGLPVTP
ncbi:MAG: hypothetical protein NWF14_02470 [Candidatus Bathyarchaeota archaeon]|nr:hypothetical protein [Candidatus Bathyarchaeota archaeon]